MSQIEEGKLDEFWRFVNFLSWASFDLPQADGKEWEQKIEEKQKEVAAHYNYNQPKRRELFGIFVQLQTDLRSAAISCDQPANFGVKEAEEEILNHIIALGRQQYQYFMAHPEQIAVISCVRKGFSYLFLSAAEDEEMHGNVPGIEVSESPRKPEVGTPRAHIERS